MTEVITREGCLDESGKLDVSDGCFSTELMGENDAFELTDTQVWERQRQAGELPRGFDSPPRRRRSQVIRLRAAGIQRWPCRSRPSPDTQETACRLWR